VTNLNGTRDSFGEVVLLLERGNRARGKIPASFFRRVHFAMDGKLTPAQLRAQLDLAYEDIKRLRGAQREIFARMVSMIGELEEWPPEKLPLLLSKHLTSPDRWELTVFVLSNRCAPATYAEWLLARGCLKDKSAREHVADLIKKHLEGRLFFGDGSPMKSKHLASHYTEDKEEKKRMYTFDGVGTDPRKVDPRTREFIKPSREEWAKYNLNVDSPNVHVLGSENHIRAIQLLKNSSGNVSFDFLLNPWTAQWRVVPQEDPDTPPEPLENDNELDLLVEANLQESLKRAPPDHTFSPVKLAKTCCPSPVTVPKDSMDTD
jgi:hypothetical protein